MSDTRHVCWSRRRTLATPVALRRGAGPTCHRPVSDTLGTAAIAMPDEWLAVAAAWRVHRAVAGRRFPIRCSPPLTSGGTASRRLRVVRLLRDRDIPERVARHAGWTEHERQRRSTSCGSDAMCLRLHRRRRANLGQTHDTRAQRLLPRQTDGRCNRTMSTQTHTLSVHPLPTTCCQQMPTAARATVREHAPPAIRSLPDKPALRQTPSTQARTG